MGNLITWLAWAGVGLFAIGALSLLLNIAGGEAPMLVMVGPILAAPYAYHKLKAETGSGPNQPESA